MFKPRVFDNSIIYHYLKHHKIYQYDQMDQNSLRIIKQACKATRGTRPGVRSRVFDLLARNRYLTTKDVQKQITRVMDDEHISDRQAREILNQCRIAAVNLKAYLWECMEVQPKTERESNEILEKHLNRMRNEMECTDFDDN